MKKRLLQRYPAVYQQFQCIAAACPDSCCAGWEIVVDAEAQERYQRMPGALGEKLRREMTIDADGDCIFRMQEERCPFWETSGLCEIHRLAGPQELCKTCAAFPRLTQDYGAFAELGLSFACPEAARLLLSEEGTPAFLERESELPAEEAACDSEELAFLMQARQKLCSILETPEPLPQQLEQLLLYACQLQDQMDFGDISAAADYTPEDCNEPLAAETPAAFLEIFRTMTILTQEWRTWLTQAADEHLPQLPEALAAAAAQAIRRYVYHAVHRYWLSVINDWEGITCIKRIVCAALLQHRMQQVWYDTKKELSFTANVRIVQLCSKELEHNEENARQLSEACQALACCTVEQLIAMLRHW